MTGALTERRGSSQPCDGRAMRPTFPAAPLSALALAACSPAPPVEAQLLRSCGPLDGPAFEIALPDGDRTMRLFGPNWPDMGDGEYDIDGEPGGGDVSAMLCNARGQACEYASAGGFTIASSEGDAFAGTLDIEFPDSGNRSAEFLARQPVGDEPPICG